MQKHTLHAESDSSYAWGLSSWCNTLPSCFAGSTQWKFISCSHKSPTSIFLAGVSPGKFYSLHLLSVPCPGPFRPLHSDGEGWILVFPGSDPEVVNITVHTFHCPQLGHWVAPNCKGSWEMWVFVCLGDKGKWEQSIRLSQLSASDSRNDENEVVAVGHFVEGKESSLDLWGLRTSPGNHHVDVCKCVYIC